MGLARRGLEQVVGAHHLLHALVVVVDHHGHVVRGHAVVAAQHDVVGRPGDRAAQPVDDRDRFAVRRAAGSAAGRPSASRSATSRGRQLAARARVHAGRRVRRGARLPDLAAAAEARVGEAALDELGQRRLVHVAALRLPHHRAVPVEAERGEVGELAGLVLARSWSSGRGPRSAPGTGSPPSGRTATPAAPSAGSRGGAPRSGSARTVRWPSGDPATASGTPAWRDLWGIWHCCHRLAGARMGRSVRSHPRRRPRRLPRPAGPRPDRARPRCSRRPTRRSAGRPTACGWWRPRRVPPPSSSGVTIVADEAIADVAGSDRHADGRRRRRHLRGRRRRAPRRTTSPGWPQAPDGSRACARGPSCSPRPGCSTAGAPPPTGACATSWPAASRPCEVDPDPIYVRDGNVWTSAGVTAGMDLALALVEDDHGRDVALAIARRFVLFLRRPANQSQFSAPLQAQAAAARRHPRRAAPRRRAPRRRTARSPRSPGSR